MKVGATLNSVVDSTGNGGMYYFQLHFVSEHELVNFLCVRSLIALSLKMQR
jgi:hypothetical protein